MSQRAVLILAALAALLAGYVLLFERTSVTSKELQQREGRVLSDFVRERVDRLELQRHGKLVVLERKPIEDQTFSPWNMLEPAQTEADQDAVDQVLGELEWLSARRTLENVSAADAKAFGLSAPRFRVWYRVGGERHMLAVGNPDVHGQSVYARTDDAAKTHVVPKTLTDALDQEPGHFRSKQLVGTVVIGWARSVELVRGNERLTLARDDSRWWFEAAPRGYADAKRIDELLRAINDLKATRYLESGPSLQSAEAALEKPEFSLAVRVVPDEKREDQEPRLAELRVGGACPDHPGERLARAGAKGAVACVGEDSLKPFLAEFGSFRLRSLLAVDPSQVEAFELGSGSHKLSLKREGEKWVPQGGLAVDREAVENWLAELASVQATQVVALPAGTSAGPEQGRLTLTLSGGKQEALLLLGLTPDRSVRVRRGDEPALALFPGGLAELFSPIPNRFVSLAPWAEQQPSAIVAVDARAEGLSRSLTLEKGAWLLVGKALPPADDLRVRELLKTLLKTRARSFVTDKPRPEHGLEKPRAALLLQRRPEAGKAAGELKLELGLEAGGSAREPGVDGPRGVYARFDGGPVFEVDQAVLAELRELAGGAPVPAPAMPAADPTADPEDEEDEHGEHGEHHAH